MAGGATITDRTVFGNKRVEYGRWWTGENTVDLTITTGLRKIEFAEVRQLGTQGTGVPRIGGPVTADHNFFPANTADIHVIASNAVSTGIWMAIGY